MNKQQVDFIAAILRGKMKATGAKPTKAYKILASKVGVSWATLYQILNKSTCSDKTAVAMVKAGWFTYQDIGWSAGSATPAPKHTSNDHLQDAVQDAVRTAYKKGLNDGEARATKNMQDVFHDGFQSGIQEGIRRASKVTIRFANHAPSVDDKVLVKVKKLAKLANDSAATTNESSNAKSAARNLLNKWLAENCQLDLGSIL